MCLEWILEALNIFLLREVAPIADKKHSPIKRNIKLNYRF